MSASIPIPDTNAGADLDRLSDFVGVLTPALIALAGVIILFWLQQSAARRSERHKAQDVAYEAFTAAFTELQVATRSKDNARRQAAYAEFMTKVVGAFWFMDVKDDFVVDWIIDRIGQMVDTLEELPQGEPEHLVVSRAFRSISLLLRHWRHSNMSRRRFRKLSLAVAERKPPPQPDPSAHEAPDSNA